MDDLPNCFVFVVLKSRRENRYQCLYFVPSYVAVKALLVSLALEDVLRHRRSVFDHCSALHYGEIDRSCISVVPCKMQSKYELSDERAARKAE